MPEWIRHIGVERGRVTVVPYSGDWRVEFEAEQQRLCRALGDCVFGIEHVGSTAVPGLCAKPIIDIAIAVEDFSQLGSMTRELGVLGYSYETDAGPDGGHIFIKESDPNVATHHVHIVRHFDSQWEDYLEFRERLRADPALRETYARLKTDFGYLHADDRKAYTASKAAFIRRVLSNSSSYRIRIFPLSDVDTNARERAVIGATAEQSVGLCFSGGGSRALSCALGQMRGLRQLGLLEQSTFISAVSGGAWAATLFTYLPVRISDEEFLGQAVENPHDLWWIPFDRKLDPSNLDYLPPGNLGHVPIRLGLLSEFERLDQLKHKYGYADDELWARYVGDVVFEPFGLEGVDEDRASPNFGQPTRFFSYTGSYVDEHICRANPDLSREDFYLVERQRPFLIVNFALFERSEHPGSALLPVESTAVGTGIRQAFPSRGADNQDLGGGLIEPFGFGSSSQESAGSNVVKANVSRRFSLADMAGLSSAAFAEMIQAHHPRFDELLPRLDYWPVLDYALPENAARSYRFADGGNLENTGIMALLARNVPRIICFVNCEVDLARVKGSAGTDVVAVDDQLPPLFGYVPIGGGDRYVKYSEIERDPSYAAFENNQVFGYEAFDELLAGLWAAKQSGGPVMYLQHLAVLANHKFDVAGDFSVRVLWVYNSLPTKWWESLSLTMRAELDADPLQFADFPHYGTTVQFRLSPAQVNLLAHMQYWIMTQDRYAVQNGLTSRQLVRSLYA